MNNKYTIKIEAPLLRPGITITTEVSEKYLVPATDILMDMVRDINTPVGQRPVKAAEPARLVVTFRDANGRIWDNNGR